MVPVMYVLIEQWYVYTPAVGNVRDTFALLVGSMSVGTPAIGVNVTVWVTDSNTHVTVAPAVTVSAAGENTLAALAVTVGPLGGFGPV